jgi:hypothetical protein
MLKFDSPNGDSGIFIDAARDSSNLFGILSRRFRLATADPGSALVNCSNRAFVRPGGKAYTGFVVSGPIFRTVLIRGIGPSLVGFGVEETLRDPALSVSRTIGGMNDDWTSENAESIRRTSAAVGAFPLSESSKDAALLVNLAPGPYVVEASSPYSTDSGEVLIEVYVLP